MFQFRAVMFNTTAPDAEPCAWTFTAVSYHDGYNTALANCPEGWEVQTVTAMHAAPSD